MHSRCSCQGSGARNSASEEGGRAFIIIILTCFNSDTVSFVIIIIIVIIIYFILRSRRGNLNRVFLEILPSFFFRTTAVSPITDIPMQKVLTCFSFFMTPTYSFIIIIYVYLYGGQKVAHHKKMADTAIFPFLCDVVKKKSMMIPPSTYEERTNQRTNNKNKKNQYPTPIRFWFATAFMQMHLLLLRYIFLSHTTPLMQNRTQGQKPRRAIFVSFGRSLRICLSGVLCRARAVPGIIDRSPSAQSCARRSLLFHLSLLLLPCALFFLFLPWHAAVRRNPPLDSLPPLTHPLDLWRRRPMNPDVNGSTKPSLRPGTYVFEKDLNTGETHQFTVGRCLGEGGFARCFEVTDGVSSYALKAVNRASLQKPKNLEKLHSEIAIHRRMKHKHIVNFIRSFKDKFYVYMLLEKCDCGTVKDLIKARPPERGGGAVRDAAMEDTKSTYRRICQGLYEFPSHVSETAQDLIRCMLSTSPSNRPTLIDIRTHPFFSSPPPPMMTPVSLLAIARRYRHRSTSRRALPTAATPPQQQAANHNHNVNLVGAGKGDNNGLAAAPFTLRDENQMSSNPLHRDAAAQAKNTEAISPHQNNNNNNNSSPRILRPSSSGRGLPQQRTPSQVHTVGSTPHPQPQRFASGSYALHGERGQSPLKHSEQPQPQQRTLAAARVRRRQQCGAVAHAAAAWSAGTGRWSLSRGDATRRRWAPAAGTRAPRRHSFTLAPHQPCQHRHRREAGEGGPHAGGSQRREPSSQPPRQRSVSAVVPSGGAPAAAQPPGPGAAKFQRLPPHHSSAGSTSPDPAPGELRAVQPAGSSASAAVPRPPAGVSLVQPTIWVRRCVDFTRKYGFCYLLSNKVVGAMFNDVTKLFWDLRSDQVVYIIRVHQADADTNDNNARATDTAPRRYSTDSPTWFPMAEYPESLKKKITLIKYFKTFLTEPNYQRRDEIVQCSAFNSSSSSSAGAGSSKRQAETGALLPPRPPRDSPPPGDENWVYVKGWARVEDTHIFRFSNKSVQVCFADGDEMFFFWQLELVTYRRPGSGDEPPIQRTLPISEVRDESKLSIGLRHIRAAYRYHDIAREEAPQKRSAAQPKNQGPAVRTHETPSFYRCPRATESRRIYTTEREGASSSSESRILWSLNGEKVSVLDVTFPFLMLDPFPLERLLHFIAITNSISKSSSFPLCGLEAAIQQPCLPPPQKKTKTNNISERNPKREETKSGGMELANTPRPIYSKKKYNKNNNKKEETRGMDHYRLYFFFDRPSMLFTSLLFPLCGSSLHNWIEVAHRGRSLDVLFLFLLITLSAELRQTVSSFSFVTATSSLRPFFSLLALACCRAPQPPARFFAPAYSSPGPVAPSPPLGPMNPDVNGSTKPSLRPGTYVFEKDLNTGETHQFTVGRCLGEGGFARCFEVTDGVSSYALKAVNRASLQKPKNLEKLHSEIAIHRRMKHKHIVNFIRSFKDKFYVYMLLEKCDCGTVKDLIKARPPERGGGAVRDAAMEDTKSTYRRICQGLYEFPSHVSETAQDLIRCMLSTSPSNRPTLIDIRTHPFFSSPPPPMMTPVSLLAIARRYRHRSTSRRALPTAAVAAAATPAAPQTPPQQQAANHNHNVNLVGAGKGDNNGLAAAPFTLRDENQMSSNPLHRDAAAQAKNTEAISPHQNNNNNNNSSPRILRPSSSGRGLPQQRTPSQVHTVGSTPHPQPQRFASGSYALHGERGQSPLKHSEQPQPQQRTPSQQHVYGGGSNAVPSPTPPQPGLPAPAGGSLSARRRHTTEMGTSGGYPRTSSPQLHPGASPARAASAAATGPAAPVALPSSSASTGIGAKPGRAGPMQEGASAENPRRSPPRQRRSVSAVVPSGGAPAAAQPPGPGAAKFQRLPPHHSSAGSTSPDPAPGELRAVQPAGSSASAAVPRPPAGVSLVQPTIWVRRCVDFTRKYGFCYLLSNKVVGAMFNDVTKLFWDLRSDQVVYIIRVHQADADTNDNNARATDTAPRRYSTDSPTWFPMAEYPESLKKKITLIKYFKTFLTEPNYQRRDEIVQCSAFNSSSSSSAGAGSSKRQAETGALLPPRPPRDSPPPGDENWVYVKGWARVEDTHIFRFSNKSVQVCFADGDEMFFFWQLELVTYRRPGSGDEPPIQRTLPISEVRDESKLSIGLRHIRAAYRYHDIAREEAPQKRSAAQPKNQGPARCLRLARVWGWSSSFLIVPTMLIIYRISPYREVCIEKPLKIMGLLTVRTSLIRSHRGTRKGLILHTPRLQLGGLLYAAVWNGLLCSSWTGSAETFYCIEIDIESVLSLLLPLFFVPNRGNWYLKPKDKNKNSFSDNINLRIFTLPLKKKENISKKDDQNQKGLLSVTRSSGFLYLAMTRDVSTVSLLINEFVACPSLSLGLLVFLLLLFYSISGLYIIIFCCCCLLKRKRTFQFTLLSIITAHYYYYFSLSHLGATLEGTFTRTILSSLLESYLFPSCSLRFTPLFVEPSAATTPPVADSLRSVPFLDIDPVEVLMAPFSPFFPPQQVAYPIGKPDKDYEDNAREQQKPLGKSNKAEVQVTATLIGNELTIPIIEESHRNEPDLLAVGEGPLDDLGRTKGVDMERKSPELEGNEVTEQGATVCHSGDIVTAENTMDDRHLNILIALDPDTDHQEQQDDAVAYSGVWRWLAAEWRKKDTLCHTTMVALTLFLLIVVAVSLFVFVTAVHRHSSESDVKWADTPFDLDTAMTALLVSKAAYCAPDVVNNWTCEVCQQDLLDFTLHRVYTNETSHTLGLSGVWHRKRLIVLAFRGTANTDNWIKNLKFRHRQYPNSDCAGTQTDRSGYCAVHAGFLEIFESIQSIIREDVQFLRDQHRAYKLLVTGHSLGGAVAVLSAVDLVSPPPPAVPKGQNTSQDWSDAIGQGTTQRRTDEQQAPERKGIIMPVHPERLLLYTFGAPRVGDANFAHWASTKLRYVFRLTHLRDVVPHLPPSSMGYVHLPTEVWFANSSDPMDFIACNDTSKEEDAACSGSVWYPTTVDHHLYLGRSTGCVCSGNESSSTSLLWHDSPVSLKEGVRYSSSAVFKESHLLLEAPSEWGLSLIVRRMITAITWTTRVLVCENHTIVLSTREHRKNTGKTKRKHTTHMFRGGGIIKSDDNRSIEGEPLKKHNFPLFCSLLVVLGGQEQQTTITAFFNCYDTEWSSYRIRVVRSSLLSLSLSLSMRLDCIFGLFLPFSFGVTFT
eukprot:gene3865-2741_t